MLNYNTVLCAEPASCHREHRNSFRIRHSLLDNGKRHATKLHQVGGGAAPLRDAIHTPAGSGHLLVRAALRYPTLTIVRRYVEHDTLIWEYLNSSIHLAPYLEKKFRKIYEGEAYQFYRQRYQSISGVDA